MQTLRNLRHSVRLGAAFAALALALLVTALVSVDGLGRLGDNAERMSDRSIAEVAAVAEQSSASAEQVSASTQETSASTQEIASSAAELARTAVQLDQLVRRFKVSA